MLNIDTSASGGARVEILGADGLPAPGFELRNRRQIIANSVAHAVSWEREAEVAKLQAAPVSLRFELRNARLYGFQFTSEPA